MQFYVKPKVVFYEKKGCGGNARQKELLHQAGVEFEIKDILNTVWTKELLEAFFEDLSVENIFNMSALKIKNNAIDITQVSKNQAIELMLKEPILIKRPLIEINNTKICGFDIDKINTLLNISMPQPKDINDCKSSVPCKSV
jgi:arsenate reductase (glutaredoxin)